MTAVDLAFPVLAWVARQVLDAEPDEQVRLSGLAVGGRLRAHAANLLSAWAVVLVLSALCVLQGALHVDSSGVPVAVYVAGAALGLAMTAAAVAVGSLASRACVGDGGVSVVVLVAAPVLTAVLGGAHNPAVNALVPRLGPALRAANDGRLVDAAPGLVAQILLWAAVVIGFTAIADRRT